MAQDGRWNPRSRVVATTAGLFTLAVLAVAPAIACTPTANVELNPSRGEPGSVITVSGSVFEPGAAPVEVRWGGTGGDIVGRAGVDDAGRFSLPFTVPGAAPGHYIVSAIQRLNDGGYKRSAASFEVPAKASASESPAQPSGDQALTETRNQEPAPANVSPPAGSSSPPAAQPAQPAPARAAQPASRVSRASAPERAAKAEAAPAGRRSGPVTAPAPAPAPDTDAAIPAQLPESSVPPMAAVGDLWSGFAAEGSPALAPGRADGPSATPERDLTTLLVGSGLVALATVMIFAAALSAFSRRRSVAEAGTTERRLN